MNNKFTDPKLKIDAWYKVFVYLGIIIVLGAIFLEVKIFDNEIIFLFGLGLLLIGIGVWNRRPTGRIIKVTPQIMSSRPNFKKRITEKFLDFPLTFLGIIFFIIGILITAYSIYEIIDQYFDI